MVAKLNIAQRLEEYKWESHHSVETFLAGLQLLNSSARAAGLVNDDVVMFQKMLNLLPSKFLAEAATMRAWRQPDWARVRLLLLLQEQMIRKQESPISNTSTSFIHEVKDRRPSGWKDTWKQSCMNIKKQLFCSHCNKKGHSFNMC